MIKNLDIFPSNPKWSIDGRQRGSTWKAFFLTLCIMAASVFMTMPSFRHIWITKTELPMVESIGPSSNAILDSFTIAGYVSNSSHIPSIIAEYTSGGRIPPMQTCPEHFVKIDPTLICFSVRPTKLTGGDSIRMYVNRTDGTYDRLIFYTEVFSSSSILNQKPLPVQRYQTVFKVSKVTANAKKNRLVLLNSLIPTADPQTFTVWTTQQLRTSILPIIPNTFFNIQFLYDESSNMMIYTIERESISTIITNYVSNAQFLIGIIGILLIEINSMNLKMDLAKILYSNEQVKNVRVSFLFTIKMMLLGLFQTIKLDKLVLRYGYLHVQNVCSKAFEDMDEKLGIENIHKIIQTLKQNQCSEKQIKEAEQTPTFDYNLALDVETEGSELHSIVGTAKLDNKMQSSRSKPKRHWITNLIRSLDSNTVAVELTVEKKEKSSLFSIIITLIGVGGLIYLLIYIGCFSLEVQRENFSVFEETDVNWNTTEFPLSFYFQLLGGASSDSFGANVTMNAYTSKNTYGISTNCSRVPLSANNQTLCINENVKFNSRDDLVIDFLPLPGMTLGVDTKVFIDAVSAFFEEQTIGLRSVATFSFVNNSIGSIRMTFVYERIIEIREGQRKEYYSQVSVGPRAAYGLPAGVKLQFRFVLSEKVRYRYISNVTLSTIFQRIWGLNMIFFIIMALYISKPYNRKIAKKMFGERFTTSTDQTVEKAQDILNINKLLLFLRSKCELVDQSNFYKQNIPYDEQQMNSSVEPLS